MLFSLDGLALGFSLSGQDDANDIRDMKKNMVYPGHSNIDIINANISLIDENAVFNIQVYGTIIRNNDTIKYGFILRTPLDILLVEYSNGSSCLYREGKGVVGYYTSKIRGDTLTIIIPKAVFTTNITNWDVVAYAKILGKYEDFLNLNIENYLAIKNWYTTTVYNPQFIIIIVAFIIFALLTIIYTLFKYKKINKKFFRRGQKLSNISYTDKPIPIVSNKKYKFLSKEKDFAQCFSNSGIDETSISGEIEEIEDFQIIKKSGDVKLDDIESVVDDLLRRCFKE